MILELRAVRTIEDRVAWAARWPEHLSGRAQRLRWEQAQPARPALLRGAGAATRRSF